MSSSSRPPLSPSSSSPSFCAYEIDVWKSVCSVPLLLFLLIWFVVVVFFTNFVICLCSQANVASNLLDFHNDSIFLIYCCCCCCYFNCDLNICYYCTNFNCVSVVSFHIYDIFSHTDTLKSFWIDRFQLARSR